MQLQLASYRCLGNNCVINWERSLICHIVNAASLRAESLFGNQISRDTCCCKYGALHQPARGWNWAADKQKQVLGKRLVGVRSGNYLPVSTPLMCWLSNYALNKPHDTHSHACAKSVTHTFSAPASQRMSAMLWCPSSSPLSLSFCLSVSWELIYVCFRSQHVRLDLPSFIVCLHPLLTLCFLWYREHFEHLWFD